MSTPSSTGLLGLLAIAALAATVWWFSSGGSAPPEPDGPDAVAGPVERDGRAREEPESPPPPDPEPETADENPPPAPVRNAVEQRVFEAATLMAKPDPAGAYRLLQDLDSGEFGEAVAACDQLAGLEQGSVERLHGLLIGLWANADPAAALDHSTQLPDADARRKLARRILDIWAGTSPESAYRWCLQAGEAATHPDAADLLGAMARAWAKGDADAALAATAGLPPSRRQRALREMSTLVTDGSARDRYLESVARLPEGEDRAQLIATTASHWAVVGRQPELAARWVSELESPEIGEIEGALAEAWSLGQTGDDTPEEFRQPGDPRAAANWLLYQPPNGARASNLLTVVTHWTASDPDAAASWLQGLSRGQLQVSDSGYETLLDAVGLPVTP